MSASTEGHSLNMFGRYSFADYTDRVRPGLVTLGGDSKVLVPGVSRSAPTGAIGSNTTADFRVGYFKY